VSDVSNPNGLQVFEGEPFLWIGGAPTDFTIFSRRPRTVTFTAEFIPGPSADRSLPGRHVRMRATAWPEAREFFLKAGVDSVSFRVPAGESMLSIEATDSWVTKIAPGNDHRPLILGVRSWRVEPFEGRTKTGRPVSSDTQ